jgi:Fe2+ transport system protein FeoA
MTFRQLKITPAPLSTKTEDAARFESLVSRAAQPASQGQRRPLTLCPAGCRATIHTDQLDLDARTMLEAMGVEHGCEVEICKVGSPCILRIESTRFGVGREVASRITATVTETLNGSALPG